MEQHLFIYTRTKYFDYRLVYSPTKQFIPDEVRWKFSDFVREVINEDNPLNGIINAPRWSFYKLGNYILWGVGCRNSALGTLNSDYTGTNVRGFFGLIIKMNTPDEKINISFSLDYFKEMYTRTIMPIFDTRKESEINGIDSLWSSDNFLTRITKKSAVALNVINDVIRILPFEESILHIVESAISYDEVNFVSGLNNDGHARKTTLCNFQNITVVGCNELKDIPFVKKQTTHEPHTGVMYTGSTHKKTDNNGKSTMSSSKLKKSSTFDKCIEGLIKFILNVSEVFGATPESIVNRLSDEFTRKTGNKNDFSEQSVSKNNETGNTSQTFTTKESDRQRLQEIVKQYNKGRKGVENEEANTLKNNAAPNTDSDIEPFSFGTQNEHK